MPAATASSLAACAVVACSSLLAITLFERPAAGWLVLAALVPGWIATRRVPGEVRAVLHSGLLAVGAIVAAVATGGGWRDVLLGPVLGIGEIMDRAWPAPTEPRPVVAVVALVCLAGSVAGEMASTRRWRMALLLPALAVAVALTAAAAPAGRPGIGWLLAWLVTAVVSVAVSSSTPTRGSVAVDPVARAGVASAAFAVAAAVAVAGIATPRGDNRADPRRDRSVTEDDLAGFESLAGVAARRTSPRSTGEFRLTPATSRERWRLFAFDRYDGLDWTVGQGLRRVGERLQRRDEQPTRRTRIEVLTSSAAWLPVNGVPQRVDAAVAADATRSVFLFTPTLTAGEVIDLAWSPQASRPAPGRVSPVEVSSNDASAPFVAAAERLAAQGDPERTPALLARLRAIELALQRDYRLDDDTPVAVSSGALRALLDTSAQGSREQFTAAFAVMARSLGAPVRIAVGYLPTKADGLLTSADLAAWPEVLVEGAGWVPFDPTPRRSASATASPASPVGPDPAAPLAEDSAGLPQPVEPPADDAPNRAPTPVAAADGNRVALVVVAMLVLVGLAAAFPFATVVAKRRRRRRRLTVGSPDDRVIGAWAEATDALVDFGEALDPGMTNVEIADRVKRVAGDEGVIAADSLARLADAAAHADALPDSVTVVLASRLLAQVDDAIAAGHDRRRRIRARCSMRSFRRSTRSPVR